MRAVKRSGFSLMEVNLAILLVAVGLMTLFGLFPAGLRESRMGVADTYEAMFADSVLSVIQGNALSMTSLASWTDTATFWTEVTAGTGLTGSAGTVQETIFPTESAPPNYVRYSMQIQDVAGSGGRRKKVSLKVIQGRMGDFALAREYFTECIYMGM